MWYKNAGKGKKVSPGSFDISALIYGIFLTFIFSIILSFILGSLSFYNDFLDSQGGFLALAIGLFSVGIGGMGAASKAGSLGWLHGVLVGISYIFLSYFLSLFWVKETAQFTLLLYRCIWGIISGGIGGMLGISL
jgi:putative membrane protein (TIGR04086 family)